MTMKKKAKASSIELQKRIYKGYVCLRIVLSTGTPNLHALTNLKVRARQFIIIIIIIDKLSFRPFCSYNDIVL